MLKILSLYLPALLFVAMMVLATLFPGPMESLSELLKAQGLVAYLAFFVSLVVATVCMPLTAIPLIPVATMTLGPLATALLSVLGWTVGGMISFLISRHVGRPVLEKFVSLKEVDSFTETLSPDTRFISIVLLRLTVPVDIVSYALGLVRHIKFWEYSIATLVGVAWFSFAFAYMGDAFFTGNTFLLLELGLLSVLIFCAGWFMLRRIKKN